VESRRAPLDPPKFGYSKYLSFCSNVAKQFIFYKLRWPNTIFAMSPPDVPFERPHHMQGNNYISACELKRRRASCCVFRRCEQNDSRYA
jgi:hypothetical protein